MLVAREMRCGSVPSRAAAASRAFRPALAATTRTAPPVQMDPRDAALGAPTVPPAHRVPPPPPDPLALAAAADWICSLPIDDFVQTVSAAAEENALATPLKAEMRRQAVQLPKSPSFCPSGVSAARACLPALSRANTSTKTLNMDDVARLQHLYLSEAAAAFGVGTTKVRRRRAALGARPRLTRPRSRRSSRSCVVRSASGAGRAASFGRRWLGSPARGRRTDARRTVTPPPPPPPLPSRMRCGRRTQRA